MFGKRSIKPFALLFLTFFAMHVGMVAVYAKGDCHCTAEGERVSNCCNCPGCLESRGGMRSSCQIRNNSTPDDKGQGPYLKPLMCTCGWGDVHFNVQSKIPFLALQHPVHFSLPSLGLIESEGQILALDDIPLSIDAPG
jgi:hypothetical protein